MAYYFRQDTLLAVIRDFMILFSLVPLTLAAEPDLSLSDHVQAVLPSIVKIKAQKSESAEDENELISADTGGTGFAIDSTHILTNAHVVGDAKKIAIVDQNNTEYPATLIGRDSKTDIALLEVEGLNLAPLKLSNTAPLRTGEEVFVVGYPFSLGPSVSMGIVSGLNRFLPNYPYLSFIQTDAAVNPGNSGGPMFNSSGELVGVVSTYFKKDGGYTNIAFAIPIDQATRIAQRVMSSKILQRGYLGAELLISENVVRKLGEPYGIFVTAIDPDSAAAKAGLRPGDVIVGINGVKLQDSGGLHRLLERSQPDDAFDVSVLRNREYITLTVRLETPKKEKAYPSNIGKNDAAEKLGLVLRENDRNIEVVIAHTTASTVGFRTGDRILGINGKTVKSIQEINERLGALKENEITFATVQREGNTFMLPVGTKTAIKGYGYRN